MKNLRKKYSVKSCVSKIWNALTVSDEIEKWTGTPAKMDGKKGTKFKLWDGDVFGKNKEMVKNKRIVQEWYGGKWRKPSIVTIEILSNGIRGNSKILLKQENIPEEEFDGINKGWDDYYFHPLREYLEQNKLL